ncbi:MAG: AI-2E family transporter [Bacteroidaceae bacterium]|nr:AI-2E family transporter [Bacteroidaceae bacterium]
MMKKEITFDRFVRILGAIIVIVLLYLLLDQLSSVLIPFFVAWLIAYLLYPIVTFFQYKCKLKYRLLSIIVTIILLLGVLYGVGLLIIPPVVDEYNRLQTIIVDYVNSQTKGANLIVLLQEYVTANIDVNELSKMFTIKDITGMLENYVPQLVSFISGSINALLGFIASLIAILYLFFILMDYENMSSGFIKMVPKGHRKFIQGMLNDVEQGMNSYFRGQSLIALIVGILFAFAFWIIDFPMAIPLGLFMGFLNLVPYLQTLGFAPAIVLALLKAHDTGDNFWLIMIAFTIAVLVVQTLQDAVITPKVMGKVTGLNAAVILLSLSVWGSLLGFIGLIIALPLTTLLISYYKRYVLKENEDLGILDNKLPITSNN